MPSSVYVMQKRAPKPTQGLVRGCVLYARVSSKEQEQEGYSIQAQLNLLRDYAAQENLQILKEFIDVETAKVAGRMQFNAMLAFLKRTPKCRTLIVEKTDRLHRNRSRITLLREVPSLDQGVDGQELCRASARKLVRPCTMRALRMQPCR